MSASRAAAMVVGVYLIAVWGAAAAGGRMPQPVPAAAAPPGSTSEQAVEQAHSALTAATARLEAHARRRDVTVAVARDPFHFGGVAREAAARHEAETAAEAASAAPEAETPAAGIRLQGMAESRTGDTLVRTAILNADGELVLATMGMQVCGRYQVVAIAADSVELEDLIDHHRQTYRMK